MSRAPSKIGIRNLIGVVGVVASDPPLFIYASPRHIAGPWRRWQEPGGAQTRKVLVVELLARERAARGLPASLLDTDPIPERFTVVTMTAALLLQPHKTRGGHLDNER